MTESEDAAAELLFFDTFSHEEVEDINLDLVQFPKPVYITQVRIIPLGARVQADFPGGVRLGATNPSKFGIEFFVNDLGMPGASTFENLGHLEYNQNDCIHLECALEKIPTDGLVLRGWYSTITLAVYGILTNSMTEPIASPPPPPCEPAAPEEICTLSAAADGRNSVMPEDVLKEEWKEPLPGEVPHVHKTTVASDFEREDLDYGLATTREHYTHHTHSGDERERRMRKASHSSERSASSRNRTHSESNERDYMREREREKGGRDWSRSPEYTRHGRRKRSDAEEPHKWPRTPPSTGIDSPTRPRSPDNLDYADEDSHYGGKLKSRSYTRGNDDSQGGTPTDSHTPLDDDDTPGTPGEQFEPILSDDEIIGDDDSSVAAADEFEMELDALAAAAEPAIVALDPYKMPLEKFTVDLQSHYADEWESLRLLFKKFDMQTKCSSEAVFKASSTTLDERENFVFLSEQLINQLAYLAQQYKRRQFVVQKFFQSDTKHLSQAVAILKIALDFEAACLQTQPAFKIRHIKIGARLTELLGSSVEFVEHLLNVEHFDIYAALFALYQQDYMALSIKLMLLKAVYALLDTKAGVRSFLGGKMNGYQLILETLQQTQLTRTKYALKAILKKLNLSEALECIRENCTNLFILANWKPSSLSEPGEPYQLIDHAMSQVLDALSSNGLSYQQPRRFLPVSKKFELVCDASAQRSFANALQAYFTQHSLAESLLLLLSNANELPMTLLMRSLDLLKSLLNSHVGVDYLVDDCFETTQMLVAVLLNLEEVPEAMVDSSHEVVAAKIAKTSELEVKKEDEVKTNEMKKASEEKTKSPVVTNEDSAALEKPVLLQHRLQRLAIELAYKVQTRYHLDAIIYTASKHDYDAIKLATHLHALCSQTCATPGRDYTISFLGLNNNIQIFMDLIKKEQRLQSQRQLAPTPTAKYKSPVLSYAVDLVDCCVRYNDNLEYLIEHGANILELAKNHESLEPSVSAVLQEMFVYLKPLEAINIFSYEDITPLVEVITRSLEYLTTFPGDLIMGLRILKHLAIGSGRRADDEMQLKHRFVALQFYAADGVQTLVQIIEKLCSYFEQPGLHSPALMSIQGIHCCQMMLPTLQVLRELLSFAIQCRDVEFRDLTAIDHLMKAYCLMHYFPAASQAASEVRQAKREIIQILLAYTQPNELDEESLHKSLWTQMIREILKNINGPSTFIPGLQVLAELLPLPLPLPLPSTVRLQESQMKRLITERKLWSAHLHPQSSQIAKLIETIAPSSFPQLSNLMVRICLQLADLAPNMTLLISKTMSDLLCNEFASAANAPTQQLVRLLSFFARLTAHASLKSSALSILGGKLWELFQAVLTISQPTEIGFKCQLSIHRILESFLDSEISLISPQSACTAELNLASALPLKELIPRIVEAIVTNLMNVDVTHEISALGVRNLVILTEHDITFYHLSLLLKQRSSDFQQWLNKIIAHNESGSYNSNIESLVLLLRSLTQIEENTQLESTIPLRTLKLTPVELATIIGFQKDVKPHLLERIRTIFESKLNSTGTLLSDINKLISQLEAMDSSIAMDTDDNSSCPEPLLPQTEGIVTQYAARPIFTVQTTLDYTQLSASQWLDSITAAQFEADYERVPCDLTELANVCLSQETNLTSDCKRLLHLSASPQSNRERTPTAPCFRTRRVEVEPSTGRPEKKIYITPVRGRGYSRPPPSRGDLFRSRPPNTSRPPSLHVDDFLALETCGAQPTGPTGYNKIPPLMRGSRVGRNRGSRISSASAYSTFSSFRKSKLIRTSSPSTWNDGGSGSPHYRTATSEPHFGGGSDSHYSSSTSHFVGRPRGRGGRMRSFLR